MLNIVTGNIQFNNDDKLFLLLFNFVILSSARKAEKTNKRDIITKTQTKTNKQTNKTKRNGEEEKKIE